MSSADRGSGSRSSSWAAPRARSRRSRRQPQRAAIGLELGGGRSSSSLPTGLAVGLALMRYAGGMPRFAPGDRIHNIGWGAGPLYPRFCRGFGLRHLTRMATSASVSTPRLLPPDRARQIIDRVMATPAGFVRSYGDVSPVLLRVAGARARHACAGPRGAVAPHRPRGRLAGEGSPSAPAARGGGGAVPG